MTEQPRLWRWVDEDDRVWLYPDGWLPTNVGRCRGCGQLILWAHTPAGKPSPLNADGVSHFATCPKAGAFRKRDEPPPFDGIDVM